MAKRDDVPWLSRKEEVILATLLEHGHLYGLEIVRKSEGQIGQGTLYVTLGRMEEKGYITSRLEAGPPDAGGLPRRVYEATPFGRRVLSAWTHITRQLVPELVR